MKILQYIFLVCLFLGMVEVHSQRYKPSSAVNYSRVDNQEIHFGYSVGIGVFDYRIINIDPYPFGSYGYRAEVVKFSPALRLGVIGEWNMTNYLSLRSVPGLYFGKRVISFVRKDSSNETNIDINKFPLEKESNINTVYADIPLLLKLRGVRINNHNYYLIGGLSYHLDLIPHNELDPLDDKVVRTNRNDFALEIGGGIDFYLEYFKLGVELRISIGLVDVMNHKLVPEMEDLHVYTRTIGSMKSTLVTLSFNFE